MKILIIQTAFIGDVVLATPLIEKLAAKNSGCTIDFLLRKGNEGLLHRHPHLRRVLVLDKSNKYKELVRLIREIRSQSYDCVINIQRFFSTGLLTVLSGGKTTIGFNKNPLSILFTRRHRHQISEDENVHEVERNILLLSGLTDLDFQPPKLYCSPQDEAVVPQDCEYICVAPRSRWFTKQFPFDKWCKLINELPKRYKVYLIGSPQDVLYCEKIRAATDEERVVVSAGQLSLLESVALIKGAQLTFTNDSAPLHFASAVNAPVIGIFCSTVPEFGFGPLSDGSTVVETKLALDCRPCGLHGKKACPKKHFRCSDIQIDDILSTAHERYGIFA